VIEMQGQLFLEIGEEAGHEIWLDLETGKTYVVINREYSISTGE